MGENLPEVLATRGEIGCAELTEADAVAGSTAFE
jgi:hypothetical protein